ncbi:MAG: hypothetical protein Q7R50_07945 [Dehalococcoidales bacterium]|nr:hypothetical protein [Dehalococcoidales bacterium]
MAKKKANKQVRVTNTLNDYLKEYEASRNPVVQRFYGMNHWIYDVKNIFKLKKKR